MPKRKTHEEYVNQLKYINPNLECLEKYCNALIKILHRCKKCNYIWKVIPNSLISTKTGCPKCSGKVKRTTEQYKIEIKERSIICCEEYINANTHIKHKCIKCEHIWNVPPDSVLRKKTGCLKCAGKMKKPQQAYIDELKNIDIGVQCLGKYINNHTKIGHQCLKCGHIWKVTPNSLLQNKSCPKCCIEHRSKSHKKYIQDLKSINKNILCLEKYVNNYTKIEHKCLLCENCWLVSPSNILAGGGCPKCNISKGENKINQFLSENKIKYVAQKSFKNLYHKCHKHPLKFDFYLPEQNLLIEYNGIQHYESSEYFGGKKTFKQQLIRDKLKKEYCLNNNINLSIIKYNQNIEKELNNIIK